MRVIKLAARPDWSREVERAGLPFAGSTEEPYWIDDRAVEFSTAQIEMLEKATADVWRMYVEAFEDLLARDRLRDLGLPPSVEPVLKVSWARRDPHVYGRFDFAWDGLGAPKLIEFNPDVPTSLVESARVQEDWLARHRSQLPKDVSQFNELESRLGSAWLKYASARHPRLVHFAHLAASAEDRCTTSFMAECAARAGLSTETLAIDQIGFDGRFFRDLENRPIDHVFKLYPWEMIWNDSFGSSFIHHPGVVEPLWKAAMSSKAMLGTLWSRNAGHPNLLAAGTDRSAVGDRFATKPFFSRQGDGVQLVLDATESRIAISEDVVFQDYARLPSTEHGHLLVGSWIVDGRPCALSVRESDGLVTNGDSRFIPHYVLPN